MITGIFYRDCDATILELDIYNPAMEFVNNTPKSSYLGV